LLGLRGADQFIEEVRDSGRRLCADELAHYLTVLERVGFANSAAAVLAR
jgi:hypothetical protein